MEVLGGGWDQDHKHQHTYCKGSLKEFWAFVPSEQTKSENINIKAFKLGVSTEGKDLPTTNDNKSAETKSPDLTKDPK